MEGEGSGLSDRPGHSHRPPDPRPDPRPDQRPGGGVVPVALAELAMRLQSALRPSLHHYLRTSVPHSFSGAELTAALSGQMDCEDAQETLHLCNLLLQHGFLFPVLETWREVKEDGSLFRFQLPYFWPSNQPPADDVDYAVYLNKRIRRKEAKHGLEEHETEAFNKLRQLLAHQWDFISNQAESQLKLSKSQRKSDKVVLDSQERAFWRLHRPPPSALPAPTLGLGQSAALPSALPLPLHARFGLAEKRLKRKTLSQLEMDVQRLRFSHKTKPWLKTPKATEMMVQWCEQFQEYDPFLKGCHPSNPWINDDDTHWRLNTDDVEVPTERRVKRWGFSVQELIRDPIGRQVLETFLESEFSSENSRFLAAVQELKFAPESEIADKVPEIFEEFLASGATCQVNVDSRTLEGTIKAMGDAAVPQRHAFSLAEEHIFTLMAKDSYPRFVRSEIYKKVLAAASSQGSRHRWPFAKRLTTTPKKFSQAPSVASSLAATARRPPSDSSLVKQVSSDSRLLHS